MGHGTTVVNRAEQRGQELCGDRSNGCRRPVPEYIDIEGPGRGHSETGVWPQVI